MAAITKVGSEFVVNTQTHGSPINPTVTGLANGGFVATWMDFSGTLGDSSGTSIKAQVFNAGGAKVGSEFLVNTLTANDQFDPKITGLANGGFVVTWQDWSPLGDGSLTSIKAQVFDAGGAKVGTEFLVNTQTANNQSRPTVTGLMNGGFVVTWDDDSGTLGDTDMSIKAQVFNAGGAKVGSEFLVNTQTALEQTSPTVTGLTNGGFVVTWEDHSHTLGDASLVSIKAQVFNAGGAKVGSEFLVNTQTANAQLSPKITGLTNGGFVVTWSDQSGTLGDSGYSIKAQVFDATGNKVGSEFLVNTQTASDQTVPTVTGLTNGGFVITWQDLSGTLGDNSGTSIKAQVFDAGGAKVGSEFLVDTQTANDQVRPAVTGLVNGGFVVTWGDAGLTLGDGNIKAQVFSVVNDANVTVVNQTTHVQTAFEATPYSGPVAGLQYQYINLTSDNLNVTALLPNGFIHTGSGFDAIDVSKVSGINVLDGGTNSNFLVGGTAAGSFDTFFVDNRSPPGDIWSTVVNFHKGDDATVWGVTQAGFNLAFANGEGAAGFTGLTLHVTKPGVPTASLTLAGYTTADLTNGKLSTSFGSVGGSDYFFVHGNS